MIRRSLRFRLAFLSMALSGVVLTTFCVGVWIAVQRMYLRQLDADLQVAGHRHLANRSGVHQWRDFQRADLTVGVPDVPYPTLVLDAQGQVVYRSELWPGGLPASEPYPLPWLAPDGGDGYPVSPLPLRLLTPLERRPPPPPGMQPQIINDQGDVVPAPQRPPDPGRLSERLIAPTWRTVHVRGYAWRLCIMGNDRVTIVLAADIARATADTTRLRHAFAFFVPLCLALIAIGGWVIGRSALRPVQALTTTVESITAQGLDQRLPMADVDEEFQRLIAVFNEMLNRLETSFHQASRFSGDAAHELNTPLTILQGELEHALQHAPDGSELQQTLSHLLEEVQRLKIITRKLLLLSRADGGRLRLLLEPFDLSEAIEMVAEDITLLNPELQVHLRLPPGVIIQADPDLMRQVLQNLATNAVRYNIEGGHIYIHLDHGPAIGADASDVAVTVANTGAPVPAADRARIFERFYRGDRARNRRVDGTGLGLSLSREIVRAHTGQLDLLKPVDSLPHPDSPATEPPLNTFRLLLRISPPPLPPSAPRRPQSHTDE